MTHMQCIIYPWDFDNCDIWEYGRESGVMHITMYSNTALLKAGVGGAGGVNEWMKVVGLDDKSCSRQKHTRDQKRYCITK